jgi:hypothetical protein
MAVDEQAPQGVPVVRFLVRVHFFLLAIALFLGAHPVAGAQNGGAPATVPSANPRTFANFPTPGADLPYLATADAWPSRWPGKPGFTGVIVEADNPRAAPQGVRTWTSTELPPTDEDVVALLKAQPAGPDGPFRSESFGSFIYKFNDPPGEVPRLKRNTADAMFRYVSAQSETRDGKPVIVVERTWFGVYLPPEGTGIRGLAVVSPGLLGTPPGTLSSISQELRKHGWVVLRMMSQPSRFTEQVKLDLIAGGDLEAQGKYIATKMGNRAAECAYAVHTACAHVESKRPELTKLPRVGVGFSGGAMTLPTIIARDPHRYSAAILVGGGADFWLMNQQSNYRDLINAVSETWADGKPDKKTLAELDEHYLRNAPLDSYHTAAVLKGKRVLMIQGTADMAVPSPLGDVLWERLGKPERWLEEDASHELLFMNLQRDYFPRMMEWLDRAVPPDRPAEPAK